MEKKLLDINTREQAAQDNKTYDNYMDKYNTMTDMDKKRYMLSLQATSPWQNVATVEDNIALGAFPALRPLQASISEARPDWGVPDPYKGMSPYQVETNTAADILAQIANFEGGPVGFGIKTVAGGVMGGVAPTLAKNKFIQDVTSASWYKNVAPWVSIASSLAPACDVLVNDVARPYNNAMRGGSRKDPWEASQMSQQQLEKFWPPQSSDLPDVSDLVNVSDGQLQSMTPNDVSAYRDIIAAKPVAPDPVAPDPVAPDPVAPDPVAPDPFVPMDRVPITTMVKSTARGAFTVLAPAMGQAVDTMGNYTPLAQPPSVPPTMQQFLANRAIYAQPNEPFAYLKTLINTTPVSSPAGVSSVAPTSVNPTVVPSGF